MSSIPVELHHWFGLQLDLLGRHLVLVVVVVVEVVVVVVVQVVLVVVVEDFTGLAHDRSISRQTGENRLPIISLASSICSPIWLQFGPF